MRTSRLESFRGGSGVMLGAALSRISTVRSSAALRELGACCLAGMIVGFLVGGVGGRLAMRISGIASGPTLQGIRTDAGFRVGEITVEGTIGFLIFGGLFTGAVGGMVYAALRPWLAGLGRWRGVAFGVIALGLLGSTILDPDNFDFGRFGPVGLNVAMFAGLFPLFGALLVPVAGRTERSVSPGVEALRWLAIVPPGLLVVGGLVQLIGELVGRMEPSPPAAPWFFLVLVVGAALRRYIGPGRVASPEGFLSYAVLAVPLVVASWLTVTGIVRIFQTAI